MDLYEPSRRKKSRVRERHLKRKKRQHNPVTDNLPKVNLPSFRLPNVPGVPDRWKDRIEFAIKDTWWYATHKPHVARALLVVLVLMFAFFVGTHWLTGKIYPGISALDVPVSGMTVDEAQTALLDRWYSDLTLELVDGERSWTVAPSQFGIELDAEATALEARSAGMTGLPFGKEIAPVVEMNEDLAISFLLEMSEQVNVAPFNAGYEWRDNRLVGVPGRNGRILDVALTVDRLLEDPAQVVKQGRLTLVMSPLPPDVLDPVPYLEDARALVEGNFRLTGYDPYRDEYVSWGTSREMLATWLEAGNGSLTLREEAFAPFLEAQNASLAQSDSTRFLESTETMQYVRQTIVEGRTEAMLRVRYRATEYTVQAGDTGYDISRKTGMPFYLIQQANDRVDLENLAVGQVIRIPSKDVTMPLDPVPHKRIVVDISTQSMVAYENGQEVFRWLIATGMSDAPTSPGVYQILSHQDVAYGSSYTMCGDTGCSQWEMYWFMGIYEVVPGLMNGFHGAVLLPNGAYLGGGNVGSPQTFGCVMSENSNAEALYHWADEGTIVEIVSSEFDPVSSLANQAFG